MIRPVQSILHHTKLKCIALTPCPYPLVLVPALAIAFQLHAQQALHNAGNLRIHNEGNLGFHLNLINDAPLNDNLGLVGFYGEKMLKVSGAEKLKFFDLELLNPEGVYLEQVLSISNSCNFILGNFHTPRFNPEVYLSFHEKAFYLGSSDLSKVNGHVTALGRKNFEFPVGDSENIRSLIISSDLINDVVQCSYFLEDPNYRLLLNSNEKPQLSPDLGGISNKEYWRLEGQLPLRVQLSWVSRLQISDLTSSIKRIVVVGWNIARRNWVSLGQEILEGGPDRGMVGSSPFVPDDYEIITLGYLGDHLSIHRMGNFLLTPNGDGVNDVFTIPENFQNANNSLEIFDRNGIMVFSMKHYSDEFHGFTNTKGPVFQRSIGLPQGIYYYILTMATPPSRYQGFIYLER